MVNFIKTTKSRTRTAKKEKPWYKSYDAWILQNGATDRVIAYPILHF